MKDVRNIVLGLLGAATIAAVPAAAQGVEDFYKSRTLSLIVSSDVGGGFDAYTRTLGRHIARHVPGTPKIVVQNMPGAASLTALNYIANIAPRDGTVFSDADSTMPFYTLLEGANSRFDPRKLNWLGSISRQIGVCVAWHASTFKTLDDAMARPMKLSGTGAAGWRYTLPRLYNIVAGSKFEVVLGYSAPQVFLSMERGETDGACVTYDTLMATKPDWLEQHKLTILAQFGPTPAAGLEKVPLALDRIKDPVDRAVMELILSQQLTGRPYVAPPEVPAPRLAALRAAFDATMNDAEFLADAGKRRLLIDPLNADQMRTLLDKAYASPPQIVERAKALMARALRK